MQHLIIGAGPAGINAAETLRRVDPGAVVRVIGDEPEPPYSRMAIPYLLTGRIGEQGTYLREREDHYAQLGIDLVQGRVASIDAQDKRVRMEDGSRHAYDRLLLATGASPVRPPIPGMDLPGVHSCWTLSDARRIQAGVGDGSDVVLIGAGFIGSIILEALVRCGARLTVVEQGERMVPRMMGPEAGELIRRWCEARGVAVRTSAAVQLIERDSQGLRVVLDGGGALRADLVIFATGVRSNTAFLDGSGVEVRQGVVVDRQFRTSVPDIFAAGDVAEGLDFSTGGHAVHAIQPTATDHGHLAALSMTGEQITYEGSVNMNVLDTLGLVSSSFGLWMGVPGGERADLYSVGDFRFLSLQFQDDRLVGAHAVGMTQHIGVLRGLIQRQSRLGVWKKRLIQDPTRLMEAYLATTQVI